jgi:hypothetical protein
MDVSCRDLSDLSDKKGGKEAERRGDLSDLSCCGTLRAGGRAVILPCATATSTTDGVRTCAGDDGGDAATTHAATTHAATTHAATTHAATTHAATTHAALHTGVMAMTAQLEC